MKLTGALNIDPCTFIRAAFCIDMLLYCEADFLSVSLTL